MAQAVQPIPVTSRRTARKNIRRALLSWLVFLPLIIIIFVPLLYMVTMAFTQEANQYLVPIRWIPQPPTMLQPRQMLLLMQV